MLGLSFFRRDVLEVARDLIGVELVWHGCSGLIVETEAYAVEGDEASHTFSRPSARQFVQTHVPGTAYVYFNYGMYWLFNLLVKGGTRDGMILVRALEPLHGLAEMRRRRMRDQVSELCSGPGKLAQALGITGRDHGTPLVGKSRPKGVGLRVPSEKLPHIVAEDIRVGISKAAQHPWRFLASGNPHVSVGHGKVKPHRPGKSLRPL